MRPAPKRTHFQPILPWEVIDKARALKIACYWELKDDGAPMICKECSECSPSNKMVYILTPDDKSGVFHKDCIDPEWLKAASKQEVWL